MILDQKHYTIFLDVSDRGPGGIATGYVRWYFESHRSGSLLAEHALKGLDEIYLSPPIPLVDRESALKTLTNDVVERIKAQELCLLKGIAREWHLPPDEKPIKVSAGVLAEEFHSCPAGTVAVVRQTDKATLAYLLPHLRMDPATGVLHSTESPLPKHASTASAKHPDVATAAASGGGLDFAHMALETASTLSFALPEPWGIVGSAALNLFDMLLPRDKSELVGDIVAALGDYMKQRDLNKWVNGAHGLMKWSGEQLESMKEVNPPKSLIADILLPGLEKNLAPGGESLYDSLLRIVAEDYIKEKDAINILLTCVSSYLFGVKFKLLLAAHVASDAYDKHNTDDFNEWTSRWLYDYVGFKNQILGSGDGAVQGWATKVAQIVDDRITDRLGKVTQVTRGDEIGIGLCQPSGSCQTTHRYYWAFTDAATSELHRFYDTVENKEDVEHRVDAEQARAAYVNTLATTLDDTYKVARQTVTKWRDSINEWNEHLRPTKPKGQPSIDPNSWQKGDGGIWARHRKVSYAVCFYNDRGLGIVGEWSAWEDINGRAYPALTNVPIDDLQMATGRRIYRKFDDSPPGPLPPVGLIPDNKTTTYIDKPST